MIPTAQKWDTYSLRARVTLRALLGGCPASGSPFRENHTPKPTGSYGSQLRAVATVESDLVKGNVHQRVTSASNRPTLVVRSDKRGCSDVATAAQALPKTKLTSDDDSHETSLRVLAHEIAIIRSPANSGTTKSTRSLASTNSKASTDGTSFRDWTAPRASADKCASIERDQVLDRLNLRSTLRSAQCRGRAHHVHDVPFTLLPDRGQIRSALHLQVKNFALKPLWSSLVTLLRSSL
jgi:hypothetical protein